MLLGQWRYPLSAFLVLSNAHLSSSQQQQWKLLYAEDFSTPLTESATDWFLETYQQPFDTIMDDAGGWYKNDYGPAFTEALNSFDTYRKEFTLGTDGWLTASLSTRDSDKNGILENAPTLQIETIGSDKRQKNVLKMMALDHKQGVILRPTNPLPEAYRIEYKLTALDFGGKRGGSIVSSDGKINGYSPDGCKTQHPWGEGSRSEGWSGNASVPYCDWQSVRTGPFAYNGFHFLAIVDFANPAPRNNHFWHFRRKVLMDSFSQHPDRYGSGTGGQVCNAITKEYYNYSDSDTFITLNMWISGLPTSWEPNPGGLAGNSQRFITDCNGGKATRGVQSAGELLTPDLLMPDEYYTFAIERNASGYTLEASGRFKRVEYKKYRFFRPFVEDEEPIWHYNVKSDEYDGSFNGDLRQVDWNFGSQIWYDQWPAGSAYPDYFVIGDLYTNVYEGSASVTDIRLYVPDPDAAPCSPISFLQTNDQISTGERVIRDGFFLYQRDNGSLEIWTGSPLYPGTIFWDSGINEAINGATYYTKLQGDSNLITWRVQVDGNSTVIWKTSTTNPEGLYSFVVECPGQGGGVAVLSGTPSQGSASIWKEESYSPPEPATLAPSPIPTVPNPVTTNFPSVPAPISSVPTPTPTVPAPILSVPAPIPTIPTPTPTVAASTQAPISSVQPPTVLAETPEPQILSDPPSQVPVSDVFPSQQPEPGCLLEPVSLMVQGDVLYTEEQIEVDDYYLYQDITGNLELWEGTQEEPGRMLWESGQLQATVDVYYTTLQGDGNLITKRITKFDESPIWQSGASADSGFYQLVLDRCEFDMLTIMNENGTVVWSEDLLVPLNATPTLEPTNESQEDEKKKSSAPTGHRISIVRLTALLLLLVAVP